MTRWITSDQLQALRVPVHDAGTALAGRALGTCQRGGDFVLDPFAAYRAQLVANPNVLVTGSIGAGKSTIVKMLVARGLERGARSVVLDPKGEYHDLARAHGGTVLALSGDDSWCSPFSGRRREDLSLVETMLAASLGRGLLDDERFVLERVFDAAVRVGEPRVLRVLFAYVEGSLYDATPSASRSLAYGLRRFVEGDLAGLFDGPGDPARIDDDLVVLDLSAAWHSEHRALVALSAMALARRVLLAGTPGGYLVVDEAWAVLGEPRVAQWLHGSWKLARANAVSHILVLHRWSDAFSSSNEGTAQRAQVTGILRDCDSAFLFRQDAAERGLLDDVLDLSARESAYVSSLPRGVALVRYGAHRSILRVVPDENDVSIIDTDQAMRAAT